MKRSQLLLLAAALAFGPRSCAGRAEAGRAALRRRFFAGPAPRGLAMKHFQDRLPQVIPKRGASTTPARSTRFPRRSRQCGPATSRWRGCRWARRRRSIRG